MTKEQFKAELIRSLSLNLDKWKTYNGNANIWKHKKENIIFSERTGNVYLRIYRKKTSSDYYDELIFQLSRSELDQILENRRELMKLEKERIVSDFICCFKGF